MNGLAKITIDGQEVVLKFGLPAIRRILEKMGQYALTEGDKYNELGLSHILFAGYLNGCMMRDEVPTKEYEEFYNLVEQFNDNEGVKVEVIAAIRAFEDSKFIKQSAEKATEKEEKKSPSIGKRSKHSPMENSGSGLPNSIK